MSLIRVRFAPSPTGALHVGGARTALFNYLFARSHGGKLILRIDDTDRERSQKVHEQDIIDSLLWLGIDWDEGPDCGGPAGPYRQSERLDSYARAAASLLESDRAYRDSGGAVRLRYPAGQIVVPDLVCGECKFSHDSLGPEPVLVRSDGSPTYHLASVCDDIEMDISHVIRGQDHLTNTAKHQVLFEALGHKAPAFAHLPLILSEEGAKLSKRNTESLVSVSEFRAHGYLSAALVNFMMLLGWSHPDAVEQLSMTEGIKAFSIERVRRTAAIFENKKLDYLNGWWLRHLPVAEVAEQAVSFTGEYRDLIARRPQHYWVEAIDALRDGMASLLDAENIAEQLCAYEVPLTEEARRELIEGPRREECRTVLICWLSLLDNFPLEPDSDCYTKEQTAQLLNRLKKELTVEKKVIFHGVRAAVMGALSGPELKVLIPLIPRELLLERARALRAELQ